jgi:capsular polysaccharide biosynthesis protein
VPVIFDKIIPDRLYEPSWLIGATTYAVDRFVPDVELIFQPQHARSGGRLTVKADENPRMLPAMQPNSRRSRIKSLVVRGAEPAHCDGYAVDTRTDNFFNWSHHVNGFLLHVLLARARLGQPVTVILPGAAPPVLRELYRLFDVEVLAIDGPTCAMAISVAQTHGDLMEAARSRILPLVADETSAAMAQLRGDQAFDKDFLARRKSRSITNMAEIESLLRARGFATIYPEDLNARDQLRLWNEASHVVAIHGAGMAPLQFRQPEQGPIRLVEVCPVGHMTRFFGSICQDVGGRYAAVRGRLKDCYVPGLYQQGQPFLRWSDDPFEVDPQSLSIALNLVEWGNEQGGGLNPDLLTMTKLGRAATV